MASTSTSPARAEVESLSARLASSAYAFLFFAICYYLASSAAGSTRPEVSPAMYAANADIAWSSLRGEPGLGLFNSFSFSSCSIADAT
jgi:hypothetical protein